MTDSNTAQISEELVHVTPIFHAEMVLSLANQTLYTDPMDAEAFAGQNDADIILVSDIHQDHMNADALRALAKEDTVIVIPQAVADMLPKDLPGSLKVLRNGEKTTHNGIEIEAIPMYNLPESQDALHTKGRGNGYVVSGQGERVYIAGDTDAVPEMLALKNITVAFLPMNPPYTMSIEEAADAVLSFKPKIVHPYHYRGPNGLNDVNKFKELVEEKDPNISVELLNFYPEE